jgi:hypothetical protein
VLIVIRVIDSNWIKKKRQMLDIICIILVKKPRIGEILIEPLIPDIREKVPKKVPMPELTFVFSLHFHVFSFVDCLVGVNCALLITDGVMILVTINFIPGSFELCIVKVLNPWNIWAPSQLDKSLSRCHECGSCNQSFHIQK